MSVPLILLALAPTGPACAGAIAGVEPPLDSNQASIVVDVDGPAVPYDPMIFGGFIEHLGKQIYGGFFDPGSPLADSAGFRLDVIEAVRELTVPVIRWPGGCFVDSYHWKKGVGEARQPYRDDRWGVLEPNTFGTHEFIELCRRLGAEPYICQNSLADIPEMADWVGYCNDAEGELAELRARNGHPEPFGVRFWSVGNEKGGRGYIDKVRDTAVAMKRVDPSIQVTCSGSHGPRDHIDPYLFETAGEHLDLLSIHEYWVPNYQQHQTPDDLACMMLSEKPDAHVGAVVRRDRGRGDARAAPHRLRRVEPALLAPPGLLRSPPSPGRPRATPRSSPCSPPATRASSRPSTPWRTPCSARPSSTPACATRTRSPWRTSRAW